MLFRFILFFVIPLVSYYIVRLIYGFFFDRECLPWPFNCGDR